MNFNEIENIYIDSFFFDPDTKEILPEYLVEYREDKARRKVSKDGLSMVISFVATGPKSSLDPEEKNAKFEIENGNFFVLIDDEIDRSPLLLIRDEENCIEYTVNGFNPDNEEYSYRFSFEIKEQECNNELNKKNKAGSIIEPFGAKDVRNKLHEILKKVATRDSDFIDTDGEPRVYIKYLSGRTGQIERYDSVHDDDLEDIQCIHECTRLDLKKHWTTASCGIVFNFAYIFNIIVDGEEHTLILRRSPTDKHDSDEFANSILESIFSLYSDILEDERHEDLVQRLERIERKLIENQIGKKNIAARKKQV